MSVPWKFHNYAHIDIPESDSTVIREAIEKVLLGDAESLTTKEKELLTKLRMRLDHTEPVSHIGDPKW
jgi:hypothetical protein